MILNAQRTVAETEDVGQEIIGELGRNREKIQSAHGKVTQSTICSFCMCVCVCVSVCVRDVVRVSRAPLVHLVHHLWLGPKEHYWNKETIIFIWRLVT